LTNGGTLNSHYLSNSGELNNNSGGTLSNSYKLLNNSGATLDNPTFRTLSPRI
jgi:hypothetical protein